jgi:flagellar biosynthesis protein FlhF
MKLQKFEADTMPQALARVKAALGADAVIMDTRSLRKPGAFGLGARECVQVWAAQSLGAAGSAPRAVPRSDNGNGAAAAMPHVDTGLLTALHARLGDLEAKLDLLSMAMAYGTGAWARKTASMADLSGRERAAALTALARRIPISGEIALGSARIVALVGPTGTGKTMTAAKLAGRMSLTQGARVGIICADGYKVGGMAEMSAYCDLLGLPMTAARDAAQMRAALDAHADRDLVLIDTAGASQRNEQHLAELRTLLEAAGVDETHLVLSAAASHAACADAVERFAAAGATHLLFTKLDESPEPAEAFAAAIAAGRPVSYLADGQAVPDDIRPADEEHMVALMTADGDAPRPHAAGRRADGGKLK